MTSSFSLLYWTTQILTPGLLPRLQDMRGSFFCAGVWCIKGYVLEIFPQASVSVA